MRSSSTVPWVSCFSASWAWARCRALFTAAGVVSSAVAVSLADQRSTSRRMSTARWRAGRCWSAATKASRMESRLPTTWAGSMLVMSTITSGTGSSHGTSRGLDELVTGLRAGHPEAGRQRAAGLVLQVGQAHVGRDAVEPGADRGAALEVVVRPPGAQVGLLDHVLGVVHRARHAVAVGGELAAVLVGHLREVGRCGLLGRRRGGSVDPRGSTSGVRCRALACELLRGCNSRRGY